MEALPVFSMRRAYGNGSRQTLQQPPAEADTWSTTQLGATSEAP